MNGRLPVAVFLIIFLVLSTDCGRLEPKVTLSYVNDTDQGVNVEVKGIGGSPAGSVWVKPGQGQTRLTEKTYTVWEPIHFSETLELIWSNPDDGIGDRRVTLTRSELGLPTTVRSGRVNIRLQDNGQWTVEQVDE